MANPRRRSRALYHSGAGGWPVGLPEKFFPGDGQSFCDSLPRARFRRFGAGGWPDGLPEISFRAMKAEGSWNASGRNGHFINQKRTSGQIFKFGLRIADFILSHGQAEPFLSRACRIATLSRPASRSGRFVKPRRGALLALASVILALGAGPLLPETTFRATAEASATAMANPRRRSRALRCSGAGGWSVGLPETIFPTASLALASVVLALKGGRTGFPKRAMKAEGSWTASGRNGRFINQKRTSGQIFKFGPRPISDCPV